MRFNENNWWVNLQPHEQQELADKYFPDNMFGALSLDGNEISSIYQSECEHDYMLRGGPAVKFYRCVKCGKTKM
jgi:hypothetical protein